MNTQNFTHMQMKIEIKITPPIEIPMIIPIGNLKEGSESLTLQSVPISSENVVSNFAQ